ncbi:hypothetical protein [Nocardia abscessus]|nr:hypothetical protein [Nocardia abscessus]
MPERGVLDLFWKTAEHLMELTHIETALAASFVMISLHPQYAA